MKEVKFYIASSLGKDVNCSVFQFDFTIVTVLVVAMMSFVCVVCINLLLFKENGTGQIVQVVSIRKELILFLLSSSIHVWKFRFS